MPRPYRFALILAAAMLTVFMAACSNGEQDAPPPPQAPPRQPTELTFNGGPEGGTFNCFSTAMASLIREAEPWIQLAPHNSGGSMCNICDLNHGRADMAILYAGDAFLGRNGQLACKENPTGHIRALAYLYGAPAQLVVRKDSPIRTVPDLKGKVVAVGNIGSGAFLSARRFFTHLGLWDAIDHRNRGYSKAASDFSTGKVDAFWVLAGYPNTAIIEATANTPVRLINLHSSAMKSGFYDLYPFYIPVHIPPGTYTGQDRTVTTFRDSALWCAGEDVTAEVVYRSLKAIFNSSRLKSMCEAHPAARSMSEASALDNLPLALHPGAVRFWSEQGKTIPAILLP